MRNLQQLAVPSRHTAASVRENLLGTPKQRPGVLGRLAQYHREPLQVGADQVSMNRRRLLPFVSPGASKSCWATPTSRRRLKNTKQPLLRLRALLVQVSTKLRADERLSDYKRLSAQTSFWASPVIVRPSASLFVVRGLTLDPTMRNMCAPWPSRR